MSQHQFRAKDLNGNWVYGGYVQEALQASGLIAEHAIQPPRMYPVAIDINTLCQYLPDVNAYEGDWLQAETSHVKSEQIEGALVFSDMEYCLETNQGDAPLICFAVIQRGTVVNTGKNIYDNPEIATYLNV